MSKTNDDLGAAYGVGCMSFVAFAVVAAASLVAALSILEFLWG